MPVVQHMKLRIYLQRDFILIGNVYIIGAASETEMWLKIKAYHTLKGVVFWRTGVRRTSVQYTCKTSEYVTLEGFRVLIHLDSLIKVGRTPDLKLLLVEFLHIKLPVRREDDWGCYSSPREME